MTNQIVVEHGGEVLTSEWTGSDVYHNGNHYRYDGGTLGGRLYNLSNHTELVEIFTHGKRFLEWIERLN